MKNYVVAIISFFENDIEMFKIVAEDEYNAVKKAMLEFCKTEENKQLELDFQNSEDYPQTLEDLYYDEMDYEVLEVKEL